MASIVCLLRWNRSIVRVRCSAAASSRCRSARSWTIRSSACTVAIIWAWMRRSSLVRSSSETLVADRTTFCVKRRALSAASGRPELSSARALLDALFDVVGQLLAGDVFGGFGLLDGRLFLGGREAEAWPRQQRRPAGAGSGLGS